MNQTSAVHSRNESPAVENIAYIHQMLGELRHMANGDGAEMLQYLIEMAFVEAGDLISAKRSGGQTDFKPPRSARRAFD